jgi:hypothetical protein
MNSKSIYPSLWRFAVLFLLQLLLFKQIALLVGPYFNILLWPLFILLLPIEISTPIAVIAGFFSGLLIDFIYGTIGIGASAGAFAAYIRPFILNAYEPKGGFSGKETIPSPHHFGWVWFAQVAAIFFFCCLFWLFAVDAFTFVYFSTITLKTLASWGLSMIFVVVFVFLSNPKN